MRPVFVDTAGWAMLVDGADPNHNAARAFRDDFLSRRGKLVTTDYVIDETLTLLRMRMGLPVAGKWWQMISGSDRLEVEWVDPQRFDMACQWFFGWSDQRFSFTDCTSFAVMSDLGIKRALTSDAHFLTAGFEVVPSRQKK